MDGPVAGNVPTTGQAEVVVLVSGQGVDKAISTRLQCSVVGVIRVTGVWCR